MSIHPLASGLAIWTGVAALAFLPPPAGADSSSDALINKLEQKGILTSDEAKALRVESEQSETNLISQLPAAKWRIADSIKTLGLYGDVRLRYEYRGADNPFPNPDAGTVVGAGNSGQTGKTYSRDRFRYAVRVGLRGDLVDDWSYGLRVETSANPRSPWVTFGEDTGKTSSAPISGTPSDKSSDTIYLGQAYLHWHPNTWFEAMAGRMPMPLYTTPLVWDSDINPEGVFEKIKYNVGPAEIFLDFGQFDYQNPSVAQEAPSSDTFLLANQVGVNVRFGKSMMFKVAPVVYIYAGHGNAPAPQAQDVNINPQNLYYPFVGQGDPSGPYKGFNVTYNQNGINNLEIVELPVEFSFRIDHTPLGTLRARIFGDLAYNYEGDNRARAAYAAAPAAFPGVTQAITGENAAYQIGFGIGSDGQQYGPTQGLVYGSTPKKGTWEARFYWQRIDQYALDVNLIDSDFFEGRANLQGFFAAFSYSITDAIIGTLRYGTANQIDPRLGTGGNNLDMPLLNPVRNYQLVQADLSWRF